MTGTTHKRDAGLLNGTPEKRMYWSIVSDYDLRTGICELIDNAVDMSMTPKRRSPVKVDLILDAQRQLIKLKDTAGGVKEQDLRNLIAPGASNNDPDAHSIGVFGVGSKRAVIALAESVCIKTRHGKSKSFQIDIDLDWLKSDDWRIPHYVIPDIDAGVTSIELSALRKSFDDSDIEDLERHLSETYAFYILDSRLEIRVNGHKLTPATFDNWCFPPDHPPSEIKFDVNIEGFDTANIIITAGLIGDREPGSDNYGVYFYCNDRLIAKELRTREVGYFVTTEAGVPHFDISLCRAIVKIDGGARMMPWNSSKSAINYNHSIFEALRPKLIQLVSHYSSLSRRLKSDWDENVFKHSNGSVLKIDDSTAQLGKKLILPPLPKVNKKRHELLKIKNKSNINTHPWTLGLIEAMAAVDIITKQELETKNRIALILLDSNFEIAIKEFIVHRHDLWPPQTTNIKQILEKRPSAIAEIQKKSPIPQKTLDKIQHYYEMRNKLIHEKATIQITDTDIRIQKESVQKVLHQLFQLTF